MGIIIKISKKSDPEKTQRALTKLANQREKGKKKLSDFYGKLKGAYGNGLEFQKKVRDEWS